MAAREQVKGNVQMTAREQVKGNAQMKRKEQVRKKKGLLLVGALIIALCLVWSPRLAEARKDPIQRELQELLERNPETADFVNSYPQRDKYKGAIDLSGEVQKGTIPLFLQWDRRWGYEPYGNSIVAISGCAPTCLSMVACGMTGETKWNPKEVAAYAEEKGYYVKGVGTSWALLEEGAAGLGLRATGGLANEQYLRDNLSAETPMICSMLPGDFTQTGHFIVLTGIDSDGKLIVNDPNSKANSEKHWDIGTFLPQIRGIWRITPA